MTNKQFGEPQTGTIDKPPAVTQHGLVIVQPRPYPSQLWRLNSAHV